MEISINQQCGSFLLAIALGAGLSLLYDLFRILRLILPESVPRIAVEDVLYCLLAGAGTMKFLLWACQGKLRAYVFFGEILGWVICHFSLSQLVLTLSEKIISLLKKILRLLYRLTLRPILLLFAGIFRFVGKIFKKLSLKRKFFLKQRGILLYNLIKSEKRPIFRKH